MRTQFAFVPPVFVAACLLAAPAFALTSPEAFLGFKVGADRKLAGYEQIVRYFELLDRESPRLELRKLGKTTLGRDLVMAVISSDQNVAGIERLRATAAMLADPRKLSESQALELSESAKTFVLVTCNIHSNEIASSQMAMEWAHQLCSSQDPKTRKWLDDVVLLLMPSINPDGQDMIVDYYKKFAGTPWEGGRLPWLYHHYAGHDNNRDWFMLNLSETRIVNQVLHKDWFPQVFLDMHQMGTTGPRMFVPPNADPLTSNVHPMQWRLNDLIGTQMGFRLEEAGRSGVISSWSYDAYWPGGTKNTACLKNVVGLLTEVASVRIATPVQVDLNELKGSPARKGLPEYRQQSNFPNPWPGGWWRLRDIVDYELIAGNALLETSSTFRTEILRNFIEMGRDGVRKGAIEKPYAYVIPADQHDPSAAAQLVKILRDNGLESSIAPEGLLTTDGRRFPANSIVFLAAQPYRAFLVEMMERQRYPEVRQGPDTKEIFRPYDVTAWTLPLMMGVKWERVDEKFDAQLRAGGWPAPAPSASVTAGRGGAGGGSGSDLLLPAASSQGYRAVNRLLAKGVRVERVLAAPAGASHRIRPGDFIVPRIAAPLVREMAGELGFRYEELGPGGALRRAALKTPRIGLYKPWAASMDEGWTRYVLDQYEYKYANLDNAAMKAKNLRAKYDVIVLPDIDKNVILEGRPRTEEPGYFEPLPSAYAGGIGKEGVAALKTFVEEGGTLVCMTSSCDLATDELGLPVRNLVARARSTEFSIPGTLVNLQLDTTHPLAWGMEREIAAYCTGGPVFGTSIPGANVGRSVVARFPEYADQVVASGWANGEEMVVGRAAIVEAQLGEGRVALLGPRVQNRAQMVGTYKFLFNAILRGGMQE